MRLVVDTNVLFSFFWKNSVTHKILMKKDLELFAPEYALEEINSYKSDIRKKTQITEGTFKKLRHELAIAVTFLPLEEYSARLKQAARISPDPNDVDFFALSLELNLPIWTNDSQLRRQKNVRVVTTADILSNPEFADIVFPLE